MENNQKGEWIKRRRGGESSAFTLATCTKAAQPNISTPDTSSLNIASSELESQKHSFVTNMSQYVPSPCGMIPHESAEGKLPIPTTLIDSALKSSSVLPSPVVENYDKHDFRGVRVEVCKNFIYFVEP